MTMYHCEFFICCFDINSHSFYIVVYSIEHRALVDDHGLELLEDVSELDDSLGNICDLALALHDGSIIICSVLLGRLLKR